MKVDPLAELIKSMEEEATALRNMRDTTKIEGVCNHQIANTIEKWTRVLKLIERNERHLC